MRTYRPVHNIGHFRYAEAAQIGENGQPSGDVTVWGDIRFPFDPALRSVSDLSMISISRHEGAAGGGEVEEEYSCDASGLVTVTIRDRRAVYRRDYSLARWQVSAKRPDLITAKHAGRPPAPRSGR